MGMITTNPFFLLTRISKNTRFFIVGSFIACLGLFLYELLPEYLFIPTLAVLYFGLPSIVIVAIFLLVPKMLSKGIQDAPQANTGPSDNMQQPLVETISLEQTKEQDMILPDNTSGGTVQGTIQSQMSASEPVNQNIIQAPVVDEVAVQEMVSRAMEPIQKDNMRMQDTITDLRSEINAIKSSMDSLASTVESSLTDLKSFQAELANPLNFMRKYFDSMDIKSLSDPSLPLHVEQLPLSEPVPNSTNEKDESDMVRTEAQENNTKGKESVSGQNMKDHASNDIFANDSNEVLTFKQMLGGKLTLGKLMTTISLMEEILQTLGRDSIDVLIDQCKLMGLNQEDEHIVYNVINMMDKSGLSVNDTLIMLYKFGKVMGMNDRESDLIYAKLMMNHGKSQENAVIVEKKVG